MDTWIRGSGGSVPKGWAMCFRHAARHGLCRSTNMVAENGNKKLKRAKNESNTSDDHAEFMRWLWMWIVLESIAPVSLAIKGRYKLRSPKINQSTYERQIHKKKTGLSCDKSKKRCEHARKKKVDLAEMEDVDLQKLHSYFEDGGAKGSKQDSSEIQLKAKAEAEHKEVFCKWLADYWNKRTVNWGGDGDCIYRATAGTAEGALSIVTDLDNDLHRDIVHEKMNLAFWHLERHCSEWEGYFEPRAGMTVSQQQAEYLQILSGFSQNAFATWRSLLATGELLCLRLLM